MNIAFDADQIRAYIVVLDGLTKQRASELRTRDTDQREGPLLQSLAMEIGDAVFSHHVVNLETRRNNSGSIAQGWYDARDACIISRGLQDDNHLAPVSPCHPVHTVGATSHVGRPNL